MNITNSQFNGKRKIQDVKNVSKDKNCYNKALPVMLDISLIKFLSDNQRKQILRTIKLLLLTFILIQLKVKDCERTNTLSIFY